MPPPFLYASSIRRAVWRTRSPAPFFYAGARALLVSHWAIDSDAAVLLTTHTFAELRSNLAIDRAEALSRAMLSIIEDRVRPDAAHPSFWAPFVVVGEGAAR